ncbi:MAG: bifunctional phosphoribosylaminoimidazolecarboxamide formyltransferase/IMP cyclohydrolase [bacterium]|nr:bifunctional phosphoribosylaminoimidazolecarboxamide formyltransferase/IMP cyclohydrolase [bacterium]
MRYALISVSDKSRLLEFARELNTLGFKIIASLGTQKILKEGGIESISVAEITGTPEILSGRVKTMHPKILGGILADRSNKTHLNELKELSIPPIDIVICNLYPFETAPGIENIDIGGVSLLRAAAKNYKWVTAVTNPNQYNRVIAELKANGEISENTRLEFAKKVFRLTSVFDSQVASFIGDTGINLTYEKVTDLRYGENPHQTASLYKTGGFGSPDPNSLISVVNARQIQGKELSFNNIYDLNTALLIIKSFPSPCACILKHANPCGVGISEGVLDAYKKAYATDPVSSFGGIVGVNREVTAELANEITNTFIEAMIAPSYTDEAKEIVKKKKNMRVLQLPLNGKLSQKSLRWIEGGLLLQDNDVLPDNEADWEVVTKREPTPAELSASKFAFKVVRFIKSNAICIATQDRTVGIGAGQPNRIGALEIALSNMKRFNLSSEETALASDGFFPFRDSIDLAHKAGIKCIIQPGGSIRDNEVINACDEYRIAMIFTHRRHFTH